MNVRPAYAHSMTRIDLPRIGSSSPGGAAARRRYDAGRMREIPDKPVPARTACRRSRNDSPRRGGRRGIGPVSDRTMENSTHMLGHPSFDLDVRIMRRERACCYQI
jgi:hypothetical protein